MSTPYIDNETEINRLKAVNAEILDALKIVLPRLAHRAQCGRLRPTEEWAAHGSMAFDNCSCEISVVRAAIAKAES